MHVFGFSECINTLLCKCTHTPTPQGFLGEEGGDADAVADMCRGNDFRTEGAKALATGLKSVPGLQKLCLG